MISQKVVDELLGGWVGYDKNEPIRFWFSVQIRPINSMKCKLFSLAGVCALPSAILVLVSIGGRVEQWMEFTWCCSSQVCWLTFSCGYPPEQKYLKRKLLLGSQWSAYLNQGSVCQPLPFTCHLFILSHLTQWIIAVSSDILLLNCYIN